MLEIRATEAKANLAALLSQVEEYGETILITRRGKEIACLSPVFSNSLRKQKIDDFKNIRSSWEKTDITAQEIISWKHDNHKY